MGSVLLRTFDEMFTCLWRLPVFKSSFSHASYTPRDVTKVLCVSGIGMHACAETKTQTHTCMCSLTC